MKQPRNFLVQVIAKRTLHVTNAAQLAQEIAAYLVSENRVSELTPIMRDVMVIRKQQGVVEAEVVSAHPLDQSALGDVKKLVHKEYPDARKITLLQRADTDTIGGLKIVMPDELLDLSVKRKLVAFKNAAVAGKD